MPSNLMIAATVFGGLGLFFFALQFLSQNLKLLAGHRLRTGIAKLTANPASGLGVGAVMITVTQSAAASVFLMVGLVRAGMMNLRQAQPVILGVSVGAGLTVLFLTIDIQLAVFLVIGGSGIFYAYGGASAVRLASVVFGIGLLFLGLQIMREGATALELQPWFQSAVELTRGQPLLGFLIGAGLTIIVQSSVAVTVVMIAFQRVGLFEQTEAIMFVYGANVGSSVLTYLLASGLTGVARQVALYLVGFNFLAALILVPLLYVEIGLGVPLVAAGVSSISSDPGTQAAIVYLVFNSIPVPFLLLALGGTARLLARFAPETMIEQHSKPKFLAGTLPKEAGLAFHLIELEQARLFNPLATALDAMRAGRTGAALDDALDAFDSLENSVSTAVDRVTSSTDLGPDAYDQLDVILKVQANLIAARQTMAGLAVEIAHLRKSAPDLSFPDAMVEGLDTILHVLVDVAEARETTDIEALSRMTSDEGNGFRSVRAAYLAGEDAVDANDRISLLAAANYCERLIWLMGEMCQSYDELRSH
ncbi:Na/Pi symporter [Aliiroseovarius sp. KMU-50]|uniref:Na/Pi symporter n=1 Tax=Aliiroseovarius salicola TaxID=3009082 RepID=A0ABT4W5F0_9RHOB|nr:Na/Pi symporter [Aliiroseovarius sp. KMU-50]MDA5095754.1 Na/Pi symporter [Aliiroseovarius sp. KMU-50]